MKISDLREIRILEFFVKIVRQIEVRSALLSWNVNKLSRVFSLFVTFSDFLLNSCPKLSNKLEKRIIFKFVLYSNFIKTKIDAILKKIVFVYDAKFNLLRVNQL